MLPLAQVIHNHDVFFHFYADDTRYMPLKLCWKTSLYLTMTEVILSRTLNSNSSVAGDSWYESWSNILKGFCMQDFYL